MRKSWAASVIVVLVALSGCGDDLPAASGTVDSMDAGNATQAAASTLPTTSPTTPPVATMTPTSECDQDRRTLEVAIEAHYAQTGSYPERTSELAGTYTPEHITSYTLGPGGSLTRVPGAGCVLVSSSDQGSSGLPVTAAEFYAQLTEEDIASVGGPDCAAELSVIGAAGQVFADREQREPLSLDELADDLERPITLWVFDADRLTIEPADGSPCTDYRSDGETTQDICDREFRTLTVATEAYYAINRSYPSSQQELVDEQFLRELIDGFTVAGGSVAPDAGSACETAWAPPTLSVPPVDCAPDRRTLEVAIEAYQAQFGSVPDNEQVLVDAGMIRTSFVTYDVVYGEIVPGDGSPCF